MYEVKRRWVLVAIALIVKGIISITQYSWFLFAYNINSDLAWDVSTIGMTFSVYIITSTMIMPLSGWIADTQGPRQVGLLAAFFAGLGPALSSIAGTPFQLTFFYAFGGIGMGALNGISTAIAVKWFPDKRGLATGIVEFGFGAGTALFNLIIQAVLAAYGLKLSFLVVGLFMWCTLIPLTLFYRYPESQGKPTIPVNGKPHDGSHKEYKPFEMVKTFQWYVMYFSFTFTVSIVLIFGAQLKMIAGEFHIPGNYLNVLMVLFPLGNGFSRIIAGAVSDRIGREWTMVMFYLLLGLSIAGLAGIGHIPWAFVTVAFIATLLGGSPFVLYPATIGDYYGATYCTANYGVTVTAKAWAGLFSGWFMGYLVSAFGTYRIPLILLSVCVILAGLASHPRILKSPLNHKGQ